MPGRIRRLSTLCAALLFLSIGARAGVVSAEENASHPTSDVKSATPTFPNAFSGLLLPSMDFSAGHLFHMGLFDFRLLEKRLHYSVTPVGIQMLFGRPAGSDSTLYSVGLTIGGEVGLVLLKPLQLVYAGTIGGLGKGHFGLFDIFTWTNRFLVRLRAGADGPIQLLLDVGWSVAYVSSGGGASPWLQGPSVGLAIVLML